VKIPDQHMHTSYSFDARETATFSAYIKKAEARGVSQLTFTDHVDLDTPPGVTECLPDYPRYVKALKTLQKKTNVSLNLGIELGYQAHLKDRHDGLLDAYPFDFVILSVHVADGLDLYNGDFFKGKTQIEAYQRYFEIVKTMVETTDNYDVIGHLDYIIRYGDFDVKDYDFDRFKPVIDAILKTIIRKNRGIELNTSGLRYGLGHTHPKKALLKRYRELGGTIITLGSDAHDPKDYQADFDQAVTLLKACGFREISLFKARKHTPFAL